MNISSTLIPNKSGLVSEMIAVLAGNHHVSYTFSGFDSNEPNSEGYVFTHAVDMVGADNAHRNIVRYEIVNNTFKELDWLIKDEYTCVYATIKPTPVLVIENGVLDIKFEISGRFDLADIGRLVSEGKLVDSIYSNGLISYTITCYHPSVQAIQPVPQSTPQTVSHDTEQNLPVTQENTANDTESVNPHLTINDELLRYYQTQPSSMYGVALPVDPYIVGRHLVGNIAATEYDIDLEYRLRNMEIWEHDAQHLHIPEGYLFASEDQRRELLCGLLSNQPIDALANDEPQMVYINVRDFATQVLYLAQSLGCKTTCTCSYYGENNTYSYCVGITPCRHGLFVSGNRITTSVPAKPVSVDEMASTVEVNESNTVKPKEETSSRLAKLISKTSSYMAAPVTDEAISVNEHPYEPDVPVVHPETYTSEEANLKAQKEVFASMDSKKEALARIAEDALNLPEEADDKSHEDLDKGVDFES